MRKVFTNFVALVVCASLLAPAAMANLDAAVMQSHQGCARAGAKQAQHHHCAGMSMEAEQSDTAQLFASSHDCCHECCLGLAFPNTAKARFRSFIFASLDGTSQEFHGDGKFTVARNVYLHGLSSRAPPTLSVL